MALRDLSARRASWPIRGTFRISRSAVEAVETVIVEIREGDILARGECRPYPRYSETIEGVLAAIEAQRTSIASGLDRAALAQRLSAGAARNALDCALWDLEAKRRGQRAWTLAGIDMAGPIRTAYTLSLDSPEAMAEAAGKQPPGTLLKLKLGGGDGQDLDRVTAVRRAAPRARLIADVNEGWSFEELRDSLDHLADQGLEMLEQPLPAEEDDLLATLETPVTLCADESCHDRASLDHVLGRYGMINVKLDKTGGLSEALALIDTARADGLKVMVGCMLASSLAMAPAMVAAQGADIVDLDGPLLLAEDTFPALAYEGTRVEPPPPELWG